MDIRFLCLEHGKKYYAVRLNGEDIFVGTHGECDRFLAIHDAKVAEAQAEALRGPRSRAMPVKTFHHSKLRA
jgi:hypothetical protein